MELLFCTDKKVISRDLKKRTTHLHRDEGKSKSLRTLLIPVQRWLAKVWDISVRQSLQDLFAQQIGWAQPESSSSSVGNASVD